MENTNWALEKLDEIKYIAKSYERWIFLPSSEVELTQAFTLQILRRKKYVDFSAWPEVS